MWRNYWTVAVRALAKSKTYSVINIAGLAIGMAACIMILLYINYERSYDSWIPDVENTYQLQAWYPHPQDGEPLQNVRGIPPASVDPRWRRQQAQVLLSWRCRYLCPLLASFK